MAWQDNLVRYRRDLHRIPELGFEEHQTHDYLWARLQEMGLSPQSPTPTGIVVDIEGRASAGPIVAIRADIDGLPLSEETGLAFASEHAGIMHACGHDAHMAIVLGLAERLLADRDAFRHVRILFQPAEERLPGGAVGLIDAGALDGVDAVYGLHVWANLPMGFVGLRAGPMMANADQFRIRVRGSGGHGSQPQATQDAVLIAAQTVVNLQTIVSRRIRPLDPAVVTCGTIHGGHTFNIIAETAEVTGTVRTFSEATQTRIAEEIVRIAERTASLYEASAEVIYEKGYPAVVNHEREVALWEEKLRGLVQFADIDPDMGSEDFAYYLQKKPGAFLFLGAAQDDGESPPHHSPHFLVNERVLPLGVEVLYRAIT